MKKYKNHLFLILVLSFTSAIIYIIQYILFHKPGDTLFYLFEDLAFVPIQAIIVTLILNKVVSIVEKNHKNKKINVIISAFFSDSGSQIISVLSKLNQNHYVFCMELNKSELCKANAKLSKKTVESFKYEMVTTPEILQDLKEILNQKKQFFISMLENPSLLEHDSFTDMLWSIFHVADELQTRFNYENLSEADLTHLKLDLARALKSINIEWINYILYLKDEYPYLYQTAIAKSPYTQL